MRSWDQQQKYEKKVRADWLASLCGKGLGINKSADMAGIGRATLHKMASRAGVRFKTDRLGAASREGEYKSCAAAGMTIKQASEHIGVSYSAVCKARTKYGIDFKVRGQAKPHNPATRPIKPSFAPKTLKTEVSKPEAKRGKAESTTRIMTMADYARIENEAMKRRFK